MLPMRTGSGLKNKILEAWSAGTPAAMTPMATNGLAGVPPELLLTAEGSALSELIVSLLKDPARRQALGVTARATAERHFSWKNKADALHSLLETARLR